VNFFRINHNHPLSQEDRWRVFDALKGCLDFHDLERVIDGLNIPLTDNIRSDVIAAYMTSHFPYVTMEDLAKTASRRMTTDGKITADEYQQWAYRALTGTYQSPTWEEAMIYAAEITKEADRAPFVHKMLSLEMSVEYIREHIEVIKNLKASDDTYVEILSNHMMSGPIGRQHAADIEHALRLGDKILASAYRKAHPAELFETANTNTAHDTPSKAANVLQSGFWKLTMPRPWRLTPRQSADTTASAEVTATQQPNSVAA
jgi:hypothetical protein